MTILNRQIEYFNTKEAKECLKKFNIRPTDLTGPKIGKVTYYDTQSLGRLKILEDDEKLKSYPLNLGKNLDSSMKIFAYDESLQKFFTLQGTVIFTSHALLAVDEDDYDFACKVMMYFLTSAVKYQNYPNVICSEEPEIDFKKKYLEDRYDFILSKIPKNSLIFIDGAYVGEQQTSYNRRMVHDLLNNNVASVFIVKNSSSRMLINNMGRAISSEYNSDFHYINHYLKVGERTSHILYVDPVNPDNQKVFGFIKCFDGIPQRYEMDYNVYKNYKDKLDLIMDLIYYFSILQGDPKNPQLRPIAIAELYAREALNYLDPSKEVLNYHLDFTMNQNRGLA
ncbi:MAG: DNA double-strand break repair nuclease NurA [Candidatus Methanosuratincola petrocarbonis]